MTSGPSSFLAFTSVASKWGMYECFGDALVTALATAPLSPTITPAQHALEDLMNIITLTTPIHDQHVWTVVEHTPDHTTLTAALPDGTAGRIVRQGSEWAAQRQRRGTVLRQLTREACAELDEALDLEASARLSSASATEPEAWAELAALEAWALETPGVELRAFGAHHCGYAIGQDGRYCGTVYWRGGRWACGGVSAPAGGLLGLALAVLRSEPQDEEPSAVVIRHG